MSEHAARPPGSLRIWSLPTCAELATIRASGIRAVVNVSSAPFASLYEPVELAGLAVVERPLTDVFSTAPALDAGPEAAASIDYVEAIDAAERDRFLEAVTATRDFLTGGRKVLVCCNHGKGRSPAVAGAALHLLDGSNAAEVYARLRALRPPCHLSMLTFAAMQFAGERCAEASAG
ncbi:MAG: hypothetical protein AAGE01_08630 [Pseudomonadota bacterium]